MKYKLLLIEDNLIDQLVTSQLLKKNLGLTDINIANNGREGMLWLKNSDINFNELIILLDIRMPEMDGFEFLSEYEKLPESLKHKTRIFMLSSTLDSEDIKRAEDNNYVQSLLSKPLPVNEFKRILFSDN
ncbi:response regulator receiver domain-containing protein [Flavobacterium cauense R2A-7]|uniref:Response regulator receiver domain-containing protein n=1 Tax=Flavobacterium cauense R2A-7 TaxID=1341154 RepID=A0A562LNR3_9FLAO|nr:response regulator [Flavobacterium cauense]KGO79810.1 histidine kinase [Flavobacterium cauense R2A-7]TWI09226.1 response regulator receiver domain-containing protein [Flavobacterium cauense R2A-7]